MKKFKVQYAVKSEIEVWAEDATEASQAAQVQPDYYSTLSATPLETFPYEVAQVVYYFDALLDSSYKGVVTARNFISADMVKLFVRFEGESTSRMFVFPEEQNKIYGSLNDLFAYLGRDLPEAYSPIAPPAPLGLNATGITTTSLTLNWMAVNGAQTYTVYQNNSILVSNLTSTQFTVSNLVPNQYATFQVSAINTGVESAKSQPYSVNTLPMVPGVPTALVVSDITEGSCVLTWNASANATTYSIYVNNALAASNVIGTTTELVALFPSSLYNVQVAAFNASGSSVLSEPAAFVTLPPTPLAPQNLTVTAVISSAVSLNWQPVLYAEAYRVYLDGELYVETAFTSAGVQGLTPSREYDFEVSAVNVTGEGDKSNLVTQMTTPGIPMNLTATNVDSVSALINWNPVAGTTTYNLYVDGILEVTGIVPSSYLLGGLEAETVYNIQVSATNAGGESVQSQFLVITTTL